MSAVTAATMPRALPASRSGPVSADLSAARAQPVRAMAADPGHPGGTTASARIAPPVWPGPGTVNLASHLIGLSKTEITYTATIALPETGADFWDMLATALPEG